jgi:glycosyltransferase involved in cell wall biosynthesis
MRYKWDLRVFWRLRGLLQREGIQVLFTFMFHPTLLGRLAGWLFDVPIRISSERTMASESIWQRLLNQWTVGLATHVVAVSSGVAAYAARAFRIPPDRLTTIPNGVDLDHFRFNQREGETGAPVIGCTARLRRENDHATLLQSFARVRDRWPGARLLIVGHGPEEEQLRRLAASLGIAERTCFVGEQADVAPWLQRMDLYLQPSVAAGMPNSILEAMAVGVPIVATAVGGTPEIVVEGETGLLVPPRDPVAMADAMLRLLESPPLAEAFGRAGRARVEAHFGERLMLRRVEALLDHLIERHLGLIFVAASGWVRG